MIIERHRTALTAAQAEQVARQFALHVKCDKPQSIDSIPLDSGIDLEGLEIHPGVLRPMSSKRLAAFLYRNREMLDSKEVIDIGSGCGLQGIVAALYGASRVILSDLTVEAWRNTSENISRFDVTEKCESRRGDLFEKIPESGDIVIFAQPYFAGCPDPRYPFTYGMLDEGELIHRFFEQAKAHVRERILMTYLDLAGDVNNPRVQGPKHGYRVIEHGPEILTTGEQRGLFWVHELTLRH
ncbi:MAG TPA: methyltransferase [Chthoniobacterales bacterium]|nr:methyltransferase [Chthoniobacterales bacterium]